MASTAKRREDALRWLRRFEAADEVERAATIRDGPRPEWSIAISLSLIESARAAGFLSPSALAIRAREDEAVRRTWERLRAGLSK
ncbi:MAG TPA: hypothetical protein VLK65_11705 [Vicinamibacteria bacterium]|nr:hypothetical protein [Vicinamibacteria bacterium]